MIRTHLARAALLAPVILASLPLCHSLLAAEIPPALRGNGELTLYRPVKNERTTFRYRDGNGNYDERVMADIAHIFRCRLTGEAHAIDAGLIEIMDAIEDHFRADEIRLISAYRSPERNTLMRRQGRRVAKRSLHMEGRAADIEVPGASRYEVRDFAHALQQGGVGYYRNRSFIHVDTGEMRTWGFKPSPARGRVKPAMSHK